MFIILMVCTGNTCRSPMAAAICQDIADKSEYRGKIKVISAGVAACSEPASGYACAIMAEQGLNLKNHRSKQLSKEQLISANLILTMTNSHKQAVLKLMPSAVCRVFTLPEFAGRTNISDISDPFGCGKVRYEECAGEIAGLLRKSWGKIVKLAGDIK